MSSLNPKRKALLAAAVMYGLEFQKEYASKIQELCKKDYTQRQIIEELRVRELYNANEDLAREILRHALRGNKAEKIGPVYDGILSNIEMRRLAKAHRAAPIKEYMKSYGCKEWSGEERFCAYLLHVSKAYTQPEIAEVLNHLFHEDNNVRNSDAVFYQLTKTRRKLTFPLDFLLENI